MASWSLFSAWQLGHLTNSRPLDGRRTLLPATPIYRHVPCQTEGLQNTQLPRRRQWYRGSGTLSNTPLRPDSPPDMVGSCLVCFQGVSGCRPGVRHDMIGHRTGSRAPSLRVSAAVRCQLWLLSVRRRHGPAWQLGRVAYKPMLQAGSLCSIRLGSQRQYPLPRPEQQLV